jgi:hypothetical protein
MLLVAAIALAAASMLPSARAAAQQGPGPEHDDSLLVRRERAQWTALEAQDTSTFARLMGGGVVDVDLSGIRRTTPASVAQFVTNCQTSGIALSGIHVVQGATTAVVTYRAALTQTCWGQRAPSSLFVMTVYERGADNWIPVAHAETPAQSR